MHVRSQDAILQVASISLSWRKDLVVPGEPSPMGVKVPMVPKEDQVKCDKESHHCSGQLSGSCCRCLNSGTTSSTQSRNCQDFCQIPRNQTSTTSSIVSSMSIRLWTSYSSWSLKFQPRILKVSVQLRLSATQTQIRQDGKSQEDPLVAP